MDAPSSCAKTEEMSGCACAVSRKSDMDHASLAAAQALHARTIKQQLSDKRETIVHYEQAQS